MWFKLANNISIDYGNYAQELRDYIFDLIAYSNNQSDSTHSYTDEEAEKDINRIFEQTKLNMQKVYQIIQNAVSSIEWSGSPIVIRVGSPPSDWGFNKPSYLEPVTDAYIQIGTKEGWGGVPGFTLFVNDEGIIVEDVLEGGDTDFFQNPATQQDYFALVDQLRNPAGKKSKNKVLTLYTARPVKDRQIFENATSIPTNLFLTTDYSRASGISRDFTSQEVRDVWRVRIEEKYLIETLNMGYVKDYQAIGRGTVPVRSISLIDPGTES